jgi:hypothetical protein
MCIGDGHGAAKRRQEEQVIHWAKPANVEGEDKKNITKNL